MDGRSTTAQSWQHQAGKQQKKMPKNFETYADLINFLERFLRGPMADEWEIDDFGSTPMPKKSGLEPWRKVVLDIIAAQRAPKGQLVHKDALPELERIIEALSYMEKNSKGRAQ